MNALAQQEHPQLQRDYGYIRWTLYVSFACLVLGGLMGPLQAFDKAQINIYQYLPFIKTYYQGLTLHGVMLAYEWTFFFITGFLTFAVAHGFNRPMHSKRLGWATFWVMLVGLIWTTWTIISNQASVLYTAYAPLQAAPGFYIGLVLVVVGTYMASINAFLTYSDWLQEHAGEKVPLISFGALITWSMWILASMGVGIEFIGFLIPWSLGVVHTVPPLLTQSLFWFTGHPIVYFWILPAYLSWYFMLPKLAGGKLFSESMARLAFLLFIPLSIPVGFHHMYTVAGVMRTAKLVQGLLTFSVVIPSLMTAFTVLASLEYAARRRGGKGHLAWIKALPWRDPAVTAQLLAMALFVFGGIGGVMLASYNMNVVVHNTMFIVGHFHITVGAPATLSFMGITYWLIPRLTGRKLWRPRVAHLQALTWAGGMALMSFGMHWQGLEGAPRRVFMSQAPYYVAKWHLPGIFIAAGGLVLFVSLVLFATEMWMSIRHAEQQQYIEVPMAEPVEDREIPRWLNRLTPWVIVSILLIVLSWSPGLWHQISHFPYGLPGNKGF